MVKKLNCWEFKERGKKLKVPHHASAAAARDGNLPQLAPNNGHLPLFLIPSISLPACLSIYLSVPTCLCLPIYAYLSMPTYLYL
jgi:hypothetical protein